MKHQLRCPWLLIKPEKFGPAGGIFPLCEVTIMYMYTVWLLHIDVDDPILCCMIYDHLPSKHRATLNNQRVCVKCDVAVRSSYSFASSREHGNAEKHPAAKTCLVSSFAEYIPNMTNNMHATKVYLEKRPSSGTRWCPNVWITRLGIILEYKIRHITPVLVMRVLIVVSDNTK